MINFMFGIHNHQPVGNFDGVFRQTYKDCYLPFINVLEKFPKVRVSLHYTGPLLEWIEENHPEYFDKLRRLADRKQIEFMGGGFYEPLLPVIPERDALGQIKMMQDYIKEKFGQSPKGMWLAERVWEPGLPKIIAKAGLRYVTIDDTHFYYAGFKGTEMFGYYITENEGYAVSVFPIDKELRYRVPFRLPEDTIGYLRHLPQDMAVTLADDGEKFGVWPGTHKWVYTDGYLERLFTMLSENSDWIRMVTFSEYMEENPAKGKVYLPTASYDEMMEWALPVDTQIEFEKVIEELKRNNQYDRMRPFVRGGFWRNFLVKYPEANQMYCKMMHVSGLVETSACKPSGKEKARRELYKAQCNCAYWHGLFGGLYLNYLRHAIYSCLIVSENMLYIAPYTEEKDYNFDGNTEVMFSTEDLNLYVAPACGGQILELDYKPKEFNLSNVLTRRPEAYHQKIPAGQNLGSGEQPHSIHDMVNAKEEGLRNILFYDWYKRNSLIDHILGQDTTLEKFSRCAYDEWGDFVNQPYHAENIKNQSIVLTRDGNVSFGDKKYGLSIMKEIKIKKNTIDIHYELCSQGADEFEIWFGIEFNLSLLAGNSKDRHYALPDKNVECQQMNIKKEIKDSHGLDLVDEYDKFSAKMNWTPADLLWRFPIETVSNSESGYERTYQGSCMMPSWKFRMEKGKAKQVDLKIEIE